MVVPMIWTMILEETDSDDENERIKGLEFDKQMFKS